MNIGSYTFQEFKRLAENFHGYAAPGLLIGGYMVEMAKARIPEGTLFEAVVETRKCLPDAVQLLTLCSAGNNWMKVHNLGRYAVSLFDKHTGEGVRVSVDPAKLDAFPEIRGWFLKEKPKKDQDEVRLLSEIEEAGDGICKAEPVTMKRRFLGHTHMSAIGLCPMCGEAYPKEDGPVCRGCQGEAPYVTASRVLKAPPTRVVPVEEAVGKTAAHDMTRIEPGAFKGPEFKAGQRISVGDICRLQQMGRFHVAVVEDAPDAGDLVHENDVAEAFARRMAGPGVTYKLPPHEGKIDFIAEREGLFSVDAERMFRFNMLPEIMVASRQDATVVGEVRALPGHAPFRCIFPAAVSERRFPRLGKSRFSKSCPCARPKWASLLPGRKFFRASLRTNSSRSSRPRRISSTVT